MSKAFHRVFIPPVADWRQWISTIDPSRARELAQTVSLINRRIRRLPRDVWNMIIGLIYHGTVHIVHEHDGGITLVNWMEYWVTHPEQQRGVPLLIAPGVDDLDNKLSGMYALSGRHHRTHDQIPKIPDCVVQYFKARWEFTGEYYRSPVLRIGEFALGVMVDDPQVLSFLTMDVNPMAPFSANYSAQMQTADGRWVTFYYNPEIPVLPVIAIQRRCYIEWHRTDVPPPPITIVYVMCQTWLLRPQSSLTLCNYIVKDGALVRRK